MDVDRFIQYLREAEGYSSRIAHLETFELRPAVSAVSSAQASGILGPLLERRGFSHLYRHQVRSLDLARRGQDQVIVTGTASGKTLCYNLAGLESYLQNRESRALYLFPTKALAQDQLKAITSLIESLPEGIAPPLAETYDGDTPSHRRKRVRTTARFIFSNPDMLHHAILPNHPRWAAFIRHLRFIVLDEIHIYRGVFGSNVANVLRRLERICRHYGVQPRYICTSATIANPVQLAEQLTGHRFELVTDDGSPRGRRYFLFWNPPPSPTNPAFRRSALSEAKTVLELLVKNGIQCLAFLRTRVQAEILYRYLREGLGKSHPALAGKIGSYRGGYLATERRRIEKELFEGRLLAVTTTNALELGIDVGCIQASVIVGHPGSLSSLWQQAGRAGRGLGSSLAIFIASNDPEDQYLVRNPHYFLRGGVETASIDPENPYILASHLGCAAFELPLQTERQGQVSSLATELTTILEQEQYLKRIDGRWYWSNPDFPASRTNLRSLGSRTYSVTQIGDNPEVLGTLDEASVQILAHPGAIYLQEGESYRVERLDLDANVAEVKRVDVDYYTRPIVQSSLQVKSVQASKRIGHAWVRLGEVQTGWKVIAFRKIKFHTQDHLGVEPLELPSQEMQTVALWLTFELEGTGEDPSITGTLIRGLQGLKGVFSSAMPMLSMCDRNDIGATIQRDQTETLALFLFDRYPGGMGFSERGFENAEQLLALGYDIVAGCRCRDGCPSCVGVTEITHSGAQEWTPSTPDKSAALHLLEQTRREGSSAAGD